MIFHRINLFRPPLHHAMCSSESNRRACVLIKELQTVAERKKNEAEISTRAFPLESPSNKISQSGPIQPLLICSISESVH